MNPAAAKKDAQDDPDRFIPVLFVDIVEKELGTAVVQAILENFGGASVYIPMHPEEHHTLCKVIGVENAGKIGKVFGTGQIFLPLKHVGANAIRRERIRQACREGRTTTSIVKEFRVSSRTVHKIRARLRRQADAK